MALPPITFERAAPVHHPVEDMQFARHDPMLCNMPGLFRYVDEKQRERTRTALRLTYVHGDGPGALTIEVHNSALLSGMDLAVLQAIVSISAVHGDTLQFGTALASHEQALIDALAAPAPETPLQAITESVQHVDFNATNLLQIVGLAVCGANRALANASIQRLATCVLLIYPTAAPRQWQRFHLLSSVQTNAASAKWNRIHVAINPHLTRIVLGEITRHTRISLDETRQLGTDQIARILHQRLCAWIDDGATRTVRYRTLLEYVWPDDLETASADAERRRYDRVFAKLTPEKVRQERLLKLRNALDKLDKLPGWSVELASDKPYHEDENLTAVENAAARHAHEVKQASAVRKARKDVFETVLLIRRGRLTKLA